MRSKHERESTNRLSQICSPMLRYSIRWRLLQAAACLGMSAIVMTPPVFGQVSGGTISGIIVDPSGAVVSGATVKITDRATGISRTLVTTSTGLFEAPNLNPATYDVIIREHGFKDEHIAAVVQVGRNDVLNTTLQLAGANAQTVEVNGSAPIIDLASSTSSDDVTGKTIRELPLNGRDWTSLSILEPNVHTVDNQYSISAGDNSRSNRGVGTQISISGTRPQQNNYRLDGITTNDYSGAGPGGALGGTLGVDAIQEFSVVTSNASAEYGRTSGGVISAVTRAGTNAYHGSAYEFIRNSALDAKNYFSTGAQPFKRNQFGGAVGGPIIKNKAFFFFNYEGIRQSRTTATVDTVPSAAARAGHLTSGNVTVDSPVIPYLAIFPLPNGTVTGDTGIWSFNSNATSREDLYTGRLDYTISQKDTIHGTGLSDVSTDNQPDIYDFTLTGLNIDRKLYSIEENHTFSSNLVNFARFGYAFTFAISPISQAAINPLAVNTSLGFVPGQNVGELRIPGISTLGGGLNAPGIYSYNYNSYQAGDDLYWTKGAHTLQFGVSYERIQSNDRGTSTNGSYVFNSIADFLTNQPQTFLSNIPGKSIPIYLRQNVFGFYAQDDWHAKKSLTLNLGLRYEPASVVGEKYNHLATLTNPASPNLKLGAPFYQNPTLLDFSPRVGFAWAPSGQGKMVIHGAYGIYDTLPLTYEFALATLAVSPYGATADLTNTAVLAGTFPKASYPLALSAQTNKVDYIQQNPGRSYVQQYLLNIQQQIGKDTSLEIGYTGAHGVRQPLKSNDGNIVEPLNTSNLNSLIWPRKNCTTSKSGKQTCITTGTKLNPTVGAIDYTAWNESTLYNAMIVDVRRNTRNFILDISYTWGKSIDESSSSNSGTNFSNSLIAPFPEVIGRFRGLSDFNVKSNFVVSGVYVMPGPKASGLLKFIGSGYQLGGIFRSATGLPFTPLISGDPLGLSSANTFSLPDRITTGSCSGNPVNLKDKANYIREECFAFPAPVNPTYTNGILTSYNPRLGNLQRNSIIGPGINSMDASLIKTTPIPSISDSFRVEFRAEAFNVLNHPNFRVPARQDSAIFNASGIPLHSAVLTQTSVDERELQFALKVIF